MRAHELGDKPIIPCAVEGKGDAIHVLEECFHKPQRLTLQIRINQIARAPLGPILPLLNERLPKHTKVVQVQDTGCYTKATVHSNNLPCGMDGHCHLTLEGGSLCVLPPCGCIHPLEGRRERPLARLILCAVLALLDLDAPHDGLAGISICNVVVLISKRVRLAWHYHEPREELVKP